MKASDGLMDAMADWVHSSLAIVMAFGPGSKQEAFIKAEVGARFAHQRLWQFRLERLDVRSFQDQSVRSCHLSP